MGWPQDCEEFAKSIVFPISSPFVLPTKNYLSDTHSHRARGIHTHTGTLLCTVRTHTSTHEKKKKKKRGGGLSSLGTMPFLWRVRAHIGQHRYTSISLRGTLPIRRVTSRTNPCVQVLLIHIQSIAIVM